MAVQRYQNSSDVDTQQLRAPLTFHFSKRTMNNRLYKASMAETLATWDPTDMDACGIPTKEVKELYRRQVLSLPSNIYSTKSKANSRQILL
jgi:hypothetical protein